ncbi:hypothetical protein HPB50_022084 [Hyalomma asiaticum]|uniref:Uncharacterized protein n=1 Tax=Hyalomma asiaticum TaxID=266040 RepID=A0ACB7TM86_HYAAI|nr:hypothetical protein HPB50_022084 [Hyalomma asiaticum]
MARLTTKRSARRTQDTKIPQEAQELRTDPTGEEPKLTDSAQRSDVPQHATNVLKPATLVLNAAAHGSAPSANMDDAGESEAKKLRVDEDKTSTYDLSEDEDIDCDETPFT